MVQFSVAVRADRRSVRRCIGSVFHQRHDMVGLQTGSPILFGERRRACAPLASAARPLQRPGTNERIPAVLCGGSLYALRCRASNGAHDWTMRKDGKCGLFVLDRIGGRAAAICASRAIKALSPSCTRCDACNGVWPRIAFTSVTEIGSVLRSGSQCTRRRYSNGSAGLTTSGAATVRTVLSKPPRRP
jgi:hypothetical protein